MKILVVEPYPYTRQTLTQLLRELGHEVYRVEECDETIPFLNSFWPDAIVMNYFLGEQTAFQLCSEIQDLFGEMPRMIIHSPVPQGSTAEIRALTLHFPEAVFVGSPFRADELQAVLQAFGHNPDADPEAAAFAALTG